MSVNFRPFAPKRRIPRNFSSKRAVLTASLSAVAAFTACGASPKAANLSPTNSETLAVSAQLPNATEGSSYTGSVTASGGTSPYNFAVTSGQMPQGVNLDQGTGSVTGTPTTAGSSKSMDWRRYRRKSRWRSPLSPAISACAEPRRTMLMAWSSNGT